MQDIAIAIGEKIHELIILEIRNIHREVMSQQEGIKHRLTALEKSSPSQEKPSAICCELRQIGMKGANIIAIRKRLRLSQAAFARLLNVDRTNLYKWEHNKVVPFPCND